MYSIIIPVYNEAEALPILLKELEATGCLSTSEFIIVDDSESDETYQACRSYWSSLKYIHRRRRLGLSDAVIEGFEAASGDLLICMDGDGSHPSSIIADLCQAYEEHGNRVIVGSRYISGGRLDVGWPLSRRLISKIFCGLARPLTPVSDPMSGCFALENELFRTRKEHLEPIGYKILLEVLVKTREKNVLEIPLEFRDRIEGDSKITLRIMLESVVHLVKSYYYLLFSKKT